MDLFTRTQEAGPDEVLIQLRPSPWRRWVCLGALMLLCLIAVRLGFGAESGSPGRAWAMVSFVLGVILQLWFWRRSGAGLELTPTELREIGGRRLVALSDVTAVKRDAFSATRPANGFTVEHTGPERGFAMAPGVWWRLGGRIAVGGITPAGEGKAMAEAMQTLIGERDPSLLAKVFGQRDPD